MPTPFNREFADGFEWVQHTPMGGTTLDLLKFPNDVSYRKRIFTEEAVPSGNTEITVMSHPAKANLYLYEECVKYLSEPGDTVMDIMAGAGSILLGGLLGRKVVAIELQDPYMQLIRLSAEKMGIQPLTLVGDCTKILPIKGIQAIVFSPPYAGTMAVPSKKRAEAREQYEQYGAGEGNIGMMRPFQYNQKMREIYQLCLESLKPGGYLALIIKDYYSGELQELGYRSWQMLMRVGFVHQDWFRWMPPGTQFKADHRALGHRTVDDEHIIIVRRPE